MGNVNLLYIPFYQYSGEIFANPTRKRKEKPRGSANPPTQKGAHLFARPFDFFLGKIPNFIPSKKGCGPINPRH
jgi:hypothetical protein